MKYPHTLTPAQIALISETLDSARDDAAAYRHEPRLKAINELRRLWQSATHVVLTDRIPEGQPKKKT